LSGFLEFGKHVTDSRNQQTYFNHIPSTFQASLLEISGHTKRTVYVPNFNKYIAVSRHALSMETWNLQTLLFILGLFNDALRSTEYIQL
jgi:hypothetical protein